MEVKPVYFFTSMIALPQLILLTLGAMITVNGGVFDFGTIPHRNNPGIHVTLDYDYSIGQFEVTIQEYIDFLNSAEVLPNGSLNGIKLIDMDDEDCEIGHDGTNFYLNSGSERAPVIEVTWFGAMAFCNLLSLKEDLSPAYDEYGNLLDMTGNITSDITKVKGYRLPTEAEWEFAARGGKKSKNFMYAGSNKVEKVAWYDFNAVWTHDVGELMGNELEIHDMSGNVSEWCQDWFSEKAYEAAVDNPVNLSESDVRVIRGGNWSQNQLSCKVNWRNGSEPDNGENTIGFRVARTEIK